MTKNFREWLLQENIANKKILIIMRGLPGSGKSYRAMALLNKHGGNPEDHIISTDNAFIPETLRRRRAGFYVSEEDELAEYKKNFSPDKLHSAHLRTHQEFKRKVDQGVTPLIIDNTNIQKEHMRPYIDYAEKNEYEIKIEYPDSPWWQDVAKHLELKPSERKGPELDAAIKVLHGRQKHGLTLDRFATHVANWDHVRTIDDIMGREPGSKK